MTREVEKIISNFDSGVICHYDMRFLKPIDTQILHSVFTKFNTIITVEDGTITGGLAGAVAKFKADNNYSAKVVSLGVPDKFISHGTIEELKEECGFNHNNIEKVIRENIG